MGLHTETTMGAVKSGRSTVESGPDALNLMANAAWMPSRNWSLPNTSQPEGWLTPVI